MSGHEQNALKRPAVAMLCVLLIAVGAACAGIPSGDETEVEHIPQDAEAEDDATLEEALEPERSSGLFDDDSPAHFPRGISYRRLLAGLSATGNPHPDNPPFPARVAIYSQFTLPPTSARAVLARTVSVSGREMEAVAGLSHGWGRIWGVNTYFNVFWPEEPDPTAHVVVVVEFPEEYAIDGYYIDDPVMLQKEVTLKPVPPVAPE